MAVAAVLLVAELATRRRVLGPWAVGALVGALAASVDLPVYAQAAAGLMAAVLVLSFVLFVIEAPSGSPQRLKPQHLVGQIGRVVEDVDHCQGLVLIAGDEWPARSSSTVTLACKVRVVSLAKGSEQQYLIVEPLMIGPRALAKRGHLEEEPLPPID